MSEGATYKINQSAYGTGDKCVCGHSWAAHGTNGMICGSGMCPCKKYEHSIVNSLRTIDELLEDSGEQVRKA